MDHAKYDEIGKIVFHTLNPLLRNLLNSIEQFRALDDTRQNSCTTRYHEVAISLYKTQHESYQSIQREIHRWQGEIESSYLYRKALNEMQTFFFLPIVLTMQHKHMYTSIHDDVSVEANDRLDVVLNNAHINTLEESAKTWHSYIQFVYEQNIELSNVQNATILLDPNLGIKILTAGTIAMSDISKTAAHDSSENKLNTGDNCHHAILAAIESLMKSQLSCTMFTEKFMNVLLQNRSFAEMLLIACMHPLNDKIEHEHSSDLVDIKGNVEFKLQSIRTLESILRLQEDNDSDRNMIWRIFFPDIFMKLYQTAFVHVRFTTSASSPKLASESMKVISTLMKRALIVPKSMVDTPLDHFQALLSGPLENETITKMTPEMKTFFERVHTIIAKPLILLINVASSNSSTLVRSALVHNVCDTILNHTAHCWNLKIDTKSNDAMQPHQVPIAALECIILGLVDENDNLSLDCTKIFNSFIASLTTMHISSWSRDICLPRVISQIETLPSLARSGRNSDLVATVRLISGYLKSFLIIGNMKKGVGKVNANLHSFLVTQLTTKEIRQCIVDCLVMDNFNTIKYGLIRNYESSQSFNLRYLNEDATNEFKVMVHSLSSLIGLKRAVLYVDGCISDLFDGISSRISHQRFVYDIEHSRWMERYFGYGVLAYLILSTIRRPSLNSKRLKYIESLSKAILPIIVSDELWKLPTTHECAKLLGATMNTSSSHANIFDSSDAVINLTSNKGAPLKGAQYNAILTSSTATTDALVANSMLQTCLLDTILSISSILQDQFRQFIPSLLYPLLSKISDLNNPSVRSASSATIAAIAKSSNYTSTEVMLSDNFAYLMEIMTIELKNPTHNGTDLFSQGYCFYSLHSVVKNIIDYEGNDHIEPQSLETRILLIVTFLSAMGMWFNRNFKKSTESLLQSIVVPLSLVRVYHSTFKQLNFLIGDDESEQTSSLSEVGFKWENLLVEFQTMPTFESETVSHADDPKEKKSTKISLSTSKSLINCADEVLQINALLLSLPDLKLQCESLDLMKQIYQLLAAIQNVAKGNQNSAEDHLVDIGNPLLQHAHRYWLSLQSNLKSAVVSYLHRDAHYKTGSARGHLAALICNLISVISTLSDYCAAFLAEKVQKDIFPLFFQMLDTFFKGSTDLTLTENDQDVLVSIAICLTKMFSKHEIGVALQATIPPLSAMILPFLGYGDILGQKVFETMKAILEVNFDFTLRSLYHLSCSRFPERPLLPQTKIREDSMPQDESNAILRKRCLDLIRFIESGPELPLY